MDLRIPILKKSIDVEKYPLCTQKSRLITESFKHTDGEPMILRRAKAFDHVLKYINIFIQDYELIVGNTASKPMGLEFDFYAGLWSQDEIDGLKENGYDITREEEAEILQMNQYWSAFNPLKRMGLLFGEPLWLLMQSGTILPPWKSREQGSGGGYAESGMGLGPGFHILTVDFENVLRNGLNQIISRAQDELRKLRYRSIESLEKAAYLKSVVIAHRAIIGFAERFAALADETAARTTDLGRKRELEKIARTCRRVPAGPAVTFYEAMQSFWFIFLMITPSPVASLGRFDQYMYPFFKKDIDGNETSEKEVLELLQCLRIKDMQINRTSGRQARQKNAGMAKWHNMVIGGVTPEGDDATNELSYLILEALALCPTPHHTVTVRVHENTPEDFMIKALRVVRTGIGMPAFVGDRSYIAYLLGEEIALPDARNYALGGCIDATVVGKSRIASYGMFVVTKVLEAALYNGIDPRTGVQLGARTGQFTDFGTFDDFMKAYKAQLEYFLELHADKNNIELLVSRELFPDPVRSSLMLGGISEGRSLLDRTFPFENAAVMNPVGMINVVDSLAAIKKLVFEEKKVSRQELLDALSANWTGHRYSEIRRLLLAAPKYGNGDDYVDILAKDLFEHWADTAVKFKTVFNGTHKPTGVSISAQWPGGLLTGATPDGRCAGECLADGSVSAMRGADTNGPTALLNSALRIDQTRYQATLLNLKFLPSSLKTDEDLRKLSCLIQTYFRHNGKHIQFNVVNETILRNAQKQPEKYRDLIVRIAGYSAYFVHLDAPIQEEIIRRTEHAKVG